MRKFDVDVTRRSFLAMAAGGIGRCRAGGLWNCRKRWQPAEDKMEEAPKEELQRPSLTSYAGEGASHGCGLERRLGRAVLHDYEAPTGRPSRPIPASSWTGSSSSDIEVKLDCIRIAAGSPPDTHYTNWVFQGPFMFNRAHSPIG